MITQASDSWGEYASRRRFKVDPAWTIALYRALITQSYAVALQREERDALQSIIRNRFKAHRVLTSERLLRNAFCAGYKALDHLDAAVHGDERSIANLHELLPKVPQKFRDTTHRPLVQTKRYEAPLLPLHTGPSVLDRPLTREEIKGPRRPATLISANSIPFLRFKKPQPRNLSNLLHQRLKQRASRIFRLEEGYEMLLVATQEDQWDQIVEKEFNLGNMPGPDNKYPRLTWRHVWYRQIWMMRRLHEEEKVKNALMAAKMHDVVVKEQKLADDEAMEMSARSKVS
ncbi:MAG: hypothetical protein Q9157_008508 [Trypethelium eluteriae]